MVQPKVYTDGAFWEDVDFYLMDRPVGADGGVIYSGDVTAYTLNIYDLTDGTKVHTETDDGNLEEFAALQTDGYWTRNDEGYSMRLLVQPDDWSVANAEGGKSYQIELLYTSTAWGLVATVWKLPCHARRSS
ncbi:MAG: hypothetical protein GY820_17855 [Gammaproteobacteria bacterium]|nr:hypothetical protein [Gammaproteobacteria bacterium]